MVTSNAQHTVYIIHKLCSLMFSMRALTPLIRKSKSKSPYFTSIPSHRLEYFCGKIKDARSYFISKNH